AREHDIDLSMSYMIGDKKIDVKAGKNAGCASVLVLTGYGKEYRDDPDLGADYIAKDIKEAAEWVIKR
ncbi:MAG: HAD hydrolase-like protein, partial [Candidatus Margulisiibacteriota bacterium]